MDERIASDKTARLHDLEEKSRSLLKHVGMYIRSRRESVGMSQREMAARAGIGKSFVHEIETGVGNPTWTQLSKLSYALGVPFAECIFQAWASDPKHEDMPDSVRRRVAALSDAISQLSEIGVDEESIAPRPAVRS
ncbi:MAG: helix-turn-helix transcriptional regulator [Pirellulaceae bacterium]